MLKKLLIGVAVLVVALLGVVLVQPSTYRVERSASIAAPPAIVMAQLASFPKWSAWSPWEALDPNQQRTYGGVEATVGHTYAWAGNDDVGAGEMTITELVPAEKLSIRLHFIKPFESETRTEFVVKPVEQGSTVTWSMSGDNDLMGKAFSLVSNMDKMIGKDFEKGLASLRTVAEAEAKKAAAPAEGAVAGPTPP